MVRKFSVSVLIPNYNGRDLLKKNLPKVFASSAMYGGGKVEVIVCDDCSADGSLDALREIEKQMALKYPNIQFRIFKNEKNLGFALSVNRGVAAATGDVLVLLNTDVFPKNDFLDPLIKHFDNHQVFAVGCLDESLENDKIILRGRGIGSWGRGFLVHARGEIDRTNTLWVNGGSGAFRKDIWKKLGGFDGLYSPFYWEDIDLSYRALKSGYEIVFESKSVVVHEHERGAIKSAYSDFRVRTIAYRNQFIFVWKNATDLNLRFSHFFWLPYHFIKALVRGDVNFFAGFFLAVLRLPQVIVSGYKAQKSYTKTDRETIRSLA
jgi:GT2 family glycosyltransferase